MFSTHQLGSLGEVKAIAVFIEKGFTIFTPLSGSSPFDFIAYKDNKSYRVQVKSSESSKKYNAYKVNVSNSHLRGNGLKARVKFFDRDEYDMLAVYLHVPDVVCFVKTSEISNRRTISFRESPTIHANKRKQWIISKYMKLPI